MQDAQVYSIRVSKSINDPNHYMSLMNFHGASNFDMENRNDVHMEIEAIADTKAVESGLKRKKKYTKRKQVENRAWIVQQAGRKYRGVQALKLTHNCCYYFLVQTEDRVFEALPVREWFNFRQVQTHKTLSCEEADVEFSKRDKTFNHFSIMKRFMKTNSAIADEEGDANKRADGRSSEDENTNGTKYRKNNENKRGDNSESEKAKESDDGDQERNEVAFISSCDESD